MVVIAILIWVGLVYGSEEVSADGSNEITRSGMLFNFEQSINGSGFANEYQNSITGPTESRSKTNGAGYIKKDERQLFQNGIKFSKYNNDYISTDRKIRVDKNEKMVSIPFNIDFAGSFRAGPIRSLWEDQDTVHQHSIGLSIILGIEQSRVITKDLSYESSGTSLDDSYKIQTTSSTKFDSNANFSGRANFGVVERNPTVKRGLVDDLVRDETYLGPMTIANKLLIAINVKTSSDEDEGLPCCKGGWSSMEPSEKRDFGFSTEDFECRCISNL
jgi:hypothetical protein